MNFGIRLKELRTEKELTQLQMSKILDTSKSNISKYEAGSVEPNIETLLKISNYFGVSIDYLLGSDSNEFEEMRTVFGYKGGDEDAVSFQHKLINQIIYSRTPLKEISDGIGVSEKTILEWLSGTNNGYSDYYQQLSDFFHVENRYWVTPRAISPGIEPTMEEYMLILLYREYQKTGVLNDIYGSLENYFPGIKLIEDSYSEKLVSAFEILNEDNKDIIIGEVKKCLKEQRYEDSVAAESTMKEAK